MIAGLTERQGAWGWRDRQGYGQEEGRALPRPLVPSPIPLPVPPFPRVWQVPAVPGRGGPSTLLLLCVVHPDLKDGRALVPEQAHHLGGLVQPVDAATAVLSPEEEAAVVAEPEGVIQLRSLVHDLQTQGGRGSSLAGKGVRANPTWQDRARDIGRAEEGTGSRGAWLNMASHPPNRPTADVAS